MRKNNFGLEYLFWSLTTWWWWSKIYTAGDLMSHQNSQIFTTSRGLLKMSTGIIFANVETSRTTISSPPPPSDMNCQLSVICSFVVMSIWKVAFDSYKIKMYLWFTEILTANILSCSLGWINSIIAQRVKTTNTKQRSKVNDKLKSADLSLHYWESYFLLSQQKCIL